MKIYFSQLTSHLKNNKPSPIYIVSGDEPWQKNEAVTMIRSAIQAMGDYEREKFSFENLNESWQHFYHSLYTHSLFANKRLIELDLQDVTLTKSMSSQLHDFVLDLKNDIVLLVKIGKTDEKITKSDWYRAMEKMALIVTIWPIPQEQLPQWIMQRAKTYGMSCPHDAATALSHLVAGNVAAAASAIEKLYLSVMDSRLRGNDTLNITTERVVATMHDANQFTVFDLVDHLLQGHTEKSLHILSHLKENHIESTIVLWAMTRELRLLHDLGSALAQGTALETLFKKNNIFPRRQPIVRHGLKRFQPSDCYQLLAQALHVDSVQKGGMIGNNWDALQQFCLRLL